MFVQRPLKLSLLVYHQPATSVPLRSSYLLPSTGQLLCFEVTPFEIMGGTNNIVGLNGLEGRVDSNIT